MIDRERVQNVVDKIKPYLAIDGGDVELVDVTDEGVVTVRLKGRCAGCPFAQMTLKGFIEKRIKDEIPEVKEVKAVFE